MIPSIDPAMNPDDFVRPIAGVVLRAFSGGDDSVLITDHESAEHPASQLRYDVSVTFAPGNQSVAFKVKPANPQWPDGINVRPYYPGSAVSGVQVGYSIRLDFHHIPAFGQCQPNP